MSAHPSLATSEAGPPHGGRAWWVPAPRGMALLIVGCWCVLLGVSFLRPSVIPAAVAAYGGALPAWVAGALWIAVGVNSLVGLCRQRLTGALGVAALAHMAWAVASLVGWTLDDVARGWVVAAAYLTFAVLINAVARTSDPPVRRRRRTAR